MLQFAALTWKAEPAIRELEKLPTELLGVLR